MGRFYQEPNLIFGAFVLTLWQSENYGDSANRDSLLSKPAGPEKNGFELIKDGK